MEESGDFSEENKIATNLIQEQMEKDDKIDENVVVELPETQKSDVEVLREDILSLQKNMNSQFTRFEEKLKEALGSFETSCNQISNLFSTFQKLEAYTHTNIANLNEQQMIVNEQVAKIEKKVEIVVAKYSTTNELIKVERRVSSLEESYTAAQDNPVFMSSHNNMVKTVNALDINLSSITKQMDDTEQLYQTNFNDVHNNIANIVNRQVKLEDRNKQLEEEIKKISPLHINANIQSTKVNMEKKTEEIVVS